MVFLRKEENLADFSEKKSYLVFMKEFFPSGFMCEGSRDNFQMNADL